MEDKIESKKEPVIGSLVVTEGEKLLLNVNIKLDGDDFTASMSGSLCKFSDLLAGLFVR